MHKHKFQQIVLAQINTLPVLTKELVEHNAEFIHHCRENTTNNTTGIEDVIQQLGRLAGIKITLPTQIVPVAPVLLVAETLPPAQSSKIANEIINNKKNLFLPLQARGLNTAETISRPELTPNDRPRNNKP